MKDTKETTKSVICFSSVPSVSSVVKSPFAVPLYLQ